MAEVGGARDAARAVADRFLTEAQVQELFDGALAVTKKVSVSCPNCKKMSYVEISDAKSVVSAIAEIVTKIAALPVGKDEIEPIIFKRLVDYGDLDGDASVGPQDGS